MSFSPLPGFSFRGLTDVAPDFLTKHGIKFLMLDLDNTLAPYGELQPTQAVIKWVNSIKNAGITLFFVSNSKKPTRVEVFSHSLGIEYLKEARKPSPTKLLQAISQSGFNKGEAALVGDQIYTDVLAANRAGVVSIIVKPISLKNPLLALRFAFESPFRLICMVTQKGNKI